MFGPHDRAIRCPDQDSRTLPDSSRNLGIDVEVRQLPRLALEPLRPHPIAGPHRPKLVRSVRKPQLAAGVRASGVWSPFDVELVVTADECCASDVQAKLSGGFAR